MMMSSPRGARIGSLCVLFCGVTFAALGAFQVQDLACEYDTQPLGLDVLTPQFSWEIQSDERNMRQSAYQVMVLKRGADAPVWDSGRVNSSVSAGIRYAGAPLESRAEYLWKVRVWDSAGNEGNWSEPGRFEMGLRDGDWFSHWMVFTVWVKVVRCFILITLFYYFL